MTAAATRTGRADSNGVGIAYEVHDGAEGPWVVAVQGLGYARWGWGPLVDLLAADHRVLLLDNRGIGASDVPAGPYDAATMAEDVVAVMDDAEVERAHVVGLSLGGMIAQELAIRHPERVDRLALVATSPGGDAAYPMPEATVALLGEVASLPPEEALERLVANAFSAAAAQDRPELVRAIVELRQANPQDPAGWQAQAAAGTTYDGGGRQGRISAPTLVVHGDQDRVLDPRNAPLLADLIDDAEVAMIPGGGHLLPFERPEELARLLTGHFTDASARKGKV